jgi:hypothetical protein
MMKKGIILLLYALLFIAMAGCVKNQMANTQSTPPKTEALPAATETPRETASSPSITQTAPSDSSPAESEPEPTILQTPSPHPVYTPPRAKAVPLNIPTNVSVNIGWGGCMCEAGGFVYYAFGEMGNEKIMRMAKDGSNPVAVTAQAYPSLYELTSDSDYLYFVSSEGDDSTSNMETIYRLPLNGGAEQEVAHGHITALQSANGKLYWDDQGKIMSANPDGSALQVLCALQNPSDDLGVAFIVGDDGIYYTCGNGDVNCDIYRWDWSGKKAIKLNTAKLGRIDMLFYDQHKFYFLSEQDDSISDKNTRPLDDSLQTLNAKGKTVTLLKNVGYFPQDECDTEFCGVSGNMFYHFVLNDCDNSDGWYVDLHQYNLKTKKDTILLHNVEIADKSIGTLFSIRGKCFWDDAVTGLYILGNDIYIGLVAGW